MNKQLLTSTFILISSCMINGMHPELEQIYRELRFITRSLDTRAHGYDIHIDSEESYQRDLSLISPTNLIKICKSPGALYNNPLFLTSYLKAKGAEWEEFNAQYQIDIYFKDHVAKTDIGKELREMANKFLATKEAIKATPFILTKKMYEERTQYGLPDTLSNQISTFLDVPYRS